MNALREEILHANLDAVVREIAEFTTKYGMTYDLFAAKLERGELGDPYGYELEQDAMHWEDLVTEKKMWLEQLLQSDHTKSKT